jgi:hypothetical protein
MFAAVQFQRPSQEVFAVVVPAVPDALLHPMEARPIAVLLQAVPLRLTDVSVVDEGGGDDTAIEIGESAEQAAAKAWPDMPRQVGISKARGAVFMGEVLLGFKEDECTLAQSQIMTGHRRIGASTDMGDGLYSREYWRDNGLSRAPVRGPMKTGVVRQDHAPEIER